MIVPYRGRIAPSPTGYLHAGHALTFWQAQQRARDNNGTLILRIEDLDPQRCRPEFCDAMFEDLARNLAVPHALGMTTVLVVPENTREVFRETWELEGRDDPHVDHVTDHLAAFLEKIATSR